LHKKTDVADRRNRGGLLDQGHTTEEGVLPVVGKTMARKKMGGEGNTMGGQNKPSLCGPVALSLGKEKLGDKELI